MPQKLNFSSAIFWKIIPLSFLLFLFSCGLKYDAPESYESFEEKRQNAVEQYVQKELNLKNQKYTSIAFGETEVVKPTNFRQLDSLYALKYENEQKGKIDNRLEEEIELQRILVLNDTNKVIYIEDHVFSIGIGDTIEYYSALFQLGDDLQVDDVVIKESVYLPVRYNELYLRYLFEESILEPGYLANSEELAFYSFFKMPLNNMSKPERDEFIMHSLDVLEVAYNISSINTSEILKALASKHLLGKSYVSFTKSYSPIMEETIMDDSGNKITSGYSFEFSYKERKEDKTFQTNSYSMEFDQYFRLVKITEL